MSNATNIAKLDPNFAEVDPDKGLHWYDIRTLDIEGRGFEDTPSPFHRLPARAESQVSAELWSLSQCSAGMSVRFTTDSTSIAVRWSVGRNALAMPHMTAIGVSGIDGYLQNGDAWQFLGSVRPREFPLNESVLIQSMRPATRTCRLFLPLYNELVSAAIGIPQDRTLFKVAPLGAGGRKPIVFYGTSVVQGGCASRPGMSHINILGRRLNYPTINLGFSGNGKAEPELAHLLGEIDASIFVIDTLPNMTLELAAERIAPFVRILRAARPTTPIVLVDHFIYPRETQVAWMEDLQRGFVAVLSAALAQLEAEGVRGLHRLGGDSRCGQLDDFAVDGTHPNDLGFAHMADAHEPILRHLLNLPAITRRP